ncbi:nitrate regulatory protein [Acerihabitans arboris]|uniref:ANTAR domain-containing protein n=1 Tax=Acerihabitans arboris TaxID=2691583 RepID=A0A845SEM3_9GAMM|nr:nitrate regulatory protein [Acerihabitans arboris]NDL61536.1 ANTAR domain-containing protein [Acerihabitans arboris]
MKPLIADTSTAIQFLLASRQSEIAALRRLLQTGELVGAVSQLVHMLQRERGVANIYLCSGLNADALDKPARNAAAAERDVLRLLGRADEANPPASDSRRLGRTAAVLFALGRLPALRRQIRQAEINPSQATEIFNAVMRSLLALVFEAADTAAEPAVSRALIAMFSFMQGKELAGQERALVAAAFASRAFSDAVRQQSLDLIDGQERCFATFSEFSDPLNLQRWREMAIDGDADVERLRRIALTDNTVTDCSLRWYEVTTRRIDLMKRVEDGLAAFLMQICRAGIGTAEDANGGDRPGDAALEALLTRQMGEPADYSVFVAAAGPGEVAEPLSNNGLSPRLGRSVLSIVGQQSRRVRDLAEELAHLRATLNDRRQIDDAKLLLMRHRRLSEEEAYNCLRRMAMNQNKKLVEVAAAILAVEEVLTDRP